MVVGQLNKLIFLLLIILFSSQNLNAVEFKGKFIQGSFILGKTKSNSKVVVDGKKIRISKEGYFVFGIGRDRKNNLIIKVLKDNKLEVFEKKIFKRKYAIQRIDGLAKKKVTIDKINPKIVKSEIDILRKIGVQITQNKSSIIVKKIKI